MPRARVFACAALLALAALPSIASAAEVLPDQILVRRFPQGQFCPLPITMTFTAPAAPVIITFTAEEFVDDGSGTLTWTEQSIDNVTLATTAQAAANTAPPPEFSSSENCYIGDPQPTPYFHFNRPGLTFALFDLFDTDPSSRGWNLGSGGYFSSRSGPRDVENDADLTGGSLGLGDGTRTPAAGLTASTSITVSGLTPGTSYDLGAWWYAGFVRFPHDTPYLTVSITSNDGTPIARRTWGGVKASYR